MNDICGIILAAGEGKRLGGRSKPLVTVDGKPLLERAIALLHSAGLMTPIVVLGYRADEVTKKIDLSNVHVVTNADWKSGMTSSLKCALGLLPDSMTSILVVPVDLPRLISASVKSLLDRQREESSKILRLIHNGTPGHPVIFPAALIDELKQLPNSVDPKEIISRHPELLIEIETNDPGCIMDVDTADEIPHTR